MTSDKKGKFPFVITNTDRSDNGRSHWWSILYIEPKTDIFFFDSFRLDGLKHFIVQDDRQVIDTILFGTEKMSRTDQKITLCNIHFNLNACKNLSAEEIDGLSDPARSFFSLCPSF